MPQQPKKSITPPFAAQRIGNAPTPESPRQGRITSFIVHSHLRWDFVWQRPQQLLSRMAATAPVLFVEEAIVLDDLASSRLVVTEPQPGIHRVVPHLVREVGATQDTRDAATLALLQELLDPDGALGERFTTPVQWFYTPMPVPTMLGRFNELAVVYDCMDELAQFRFAPPDLVAREHELLANADVVFTGGRRLYDAKRRHHDNVHFFGCGVDERHYATARDVSTVVPPEIAALAGPVLGYVGVIDERLDYDLIGALAAAFPEASVAMVGPVVKVDPASLPSAPNIHWFGQRSYDQLPSIVRGFDVCLMPFALNEATEYINPTKTLEYLAAGRPVVSTPVPDVRANFAAYVAIGESVERFTSLVQAAVTSPDPVALARGIEHARESGWDQIVTTMVGHIEAAVRARVARPLRSAVSAAAAREAVREGSRESRTGSGAR